MTISCIVKYSSFDLFPQPLKNVKWAVEKQVPIGFGSWAVVTEP